MAIAQHFELGSFYLININGIEKLAVSRFRASMIRESGDRSSKCSAQRIPYEKFSSIRNFLSEISNQNLTTCQTVWQATHCPMKQSRVGTDDKNVFKTPDTVYRSAADGSRNDFYL